MAKFLSKQNLEHIYNYLKTDLEAINIKLDEDKKYRKAVKTMMRSIDNQHRESDKQMSVENLNVYAVSKIKPFLVEMEQQHGEWYPYLNILWNFLRWN